MEHYQSTSTSQPLRTPTVDKRASRREDECSLLPQLRSNSRTLSSHAEQMKDVLLAMSNELIHDALDLEFQLMKQIQLLENHIRDKGTPNSQFLSSTATHPFQYETLKSTNLNMDYPQNEFRAQFSEQGRSGPLTSRKQTIPQDVNLSSIMYSTLRKLRTLIVKEAADGVMAYHIFGNATLQQMSVRIPRTKEELLKIHGLGKAKVLKYGDRLLETIESTINEYYRTKKKDSVINKDSPDPEKRRRDENISPNGEGPLTSGKQTTLPLPIADTPPQELNMPAIMHSALRKLRTLIVKEAADDRVMPYHIFGNATIQEMSVRIPRTKEKLLKIHGPGKAKVLKYGDRLLETIESTVNEYHGTNKKDSVISNDSPDSQKRRRDENISRTER